MKKAELQKMKALTATPKMMRLAAEDVPKKVIEKDYWGYDRVREKAEYRLFMRCQVQNGILKVTFFLPETMRMGGRLPAYELYIHKETTDFITYDRCNAKWLDAKLDRINWPRQGADAPNRWIAPKDNALLKSYLGTERAGYMGILDYQYSIRREQLKARHKRKTDPWDQDLAQTPALPKDWEHWVDKVGIPENYIFYKYVRGGARTGWCTYCGKEVPISRPHHNKTGRCRCCRHEITFKAAGRMPGLLSIPESFVYLPQRCRDGFMLREFQVRRCYRKDNYRQPEIKIWEKRRAIFDGSAKPLRAYYWGDYKHYEDRWIKTEVCNPNWSGDEAGRCYGRTLPSLAAKELRYTGLPEIIRKFGRLDPEKYLAVHHVLPIVEQFAKAGLYRLVRECLRNYWDFYSFAEDSTAGSLTKRLGIDTQELKRLRENQGGLAYLNWLRFEKSTGKLLDEQMIRWLCEEKIDKDDLEFILDRMSIQQAVNYIQRQMQENQMSSRTVLTTWKDYLSMAARLKMDTSDAIIYRVRKLRQRHDELVEQLRVQELALEAERIMEQCPHLKDIFTELKDVYSYGNDRFSVVVPANVEQIMQEGRDLHHCVGSSDRYFERMERRESYILFLRRTAEPEKAYYTLEVEPDGTVRQKRTLYNRQDMDIGEVRAFLKEWQKAIAEQITAKERSLAQASRELRIEEFTKMQQDGIKVNIGELQGQLLADVLRADLMENQENAAPAELPAAA